MKISILKNETFMAILAAVGLLTVSLLSVSLASTNAIGEGQIAGGDVYRLRNVTKNTAFSDPASASKCETVQYKVRMHNPGPGDVSNVNVKVSLPATASTKNVSTATISGQNAQPASVSDTATLNLSEALKVSYLSGSTQLLDTNSNVISSLPDGITGGGVNVGKVGVSLKEIKFVQFKAKTDCPKPPEKFFKCEALNVATVDMKNYRFDAVAQVQNVTVQSYTFNVTKNGQQYDQKVVTTNALTARYDLTNAGPGTYTVTAVVNTDAGSTNLETCKKTVKVAEKPKPDKKFKCEALNVATTDNKNYRFDAVASAQNVTIQNYVFSAHKDGKLVDQKVVTTSALTARYDFSQSAQGKYIVTVVINTDAGSTNPKDCAKEVTVPGDHTPPKPPLVPPQVPPFVPPSIPETPGGEVSAAILPEAGPADTAAIVALVTTMSTIAYYTVIRRFVSL